nr:MAG TPA: hypothetical protein [Caudoviricetes sp.]
MSHVGQSLRTHSYNSYICRNCRSDCRNYSYNCSAVVEPILKNVGLVGQKYIYFIKIERLGKSYRLMRLYLYIYTRVYPTTPTDKKWRN